MRFELETSGWSYTPSDAKALEALGFEFTPLVGSIYPSCTFRKTDKKVYVEIADLKALVDFASTWEPLIVHINSIEIYDDHRE